MARLNPKTLHYEFSGPYFTPVMVVGMLAVPVLLATLCNDTGCPPSWLVNNLTIESVAEALFPKDVLRWDAFAAILAWQAFHIALYLILPGRVAKGTLLRDNKTRLDYPINGFSAFLVVISLVGISMYYFNLSVLLWIADNYIHLVAAGIFISLVQSVGLYVASFRNDRVLLALGGNTGSPIYDFFIGRELNPRIFGIDFKYLFELRPGLIGWVLLNLSFAARQGFNRAATVTGGTPSVVEAFSSVTNSMWLVLIFQSYYVIDALWFESAILTTMDITTDGFGFMLNYGDTVWVPFTYTVQSRFLSFHPIDLSPLAVVSLIGLKLVGLYIFRSSNGQKNAFRTDPDGISTKHLKYMQTSSGSKLLISGWWGTARHINYTGDWIMALSWCLPTGFSTPITYFYALYFAILLWHRELRDEDKCKKKYGRDWDKYCKIVPYRFIPGVY